jgi:opacity protein-like surface antigen
MRKAILGAASALALASPAVAADLPVTPRYSEVPSYEREVHTYEYRRVPPLVVEEPAPVVSETVVVRRPVIVAPPPVVVDEYPVYAAPRVYAASPVYAYAGPVWREGWGHRRHFRGRW